MSLVVEPWYFFSITQEQQMDHYLDWKYVTENRFRSFYWQIHEVLSFQPSSILEVGVGSGVVNAIIADRMLKTTTVDIEQSLEPDIVGSISNLPISHCSFDVVLCCEVLEHLDYSMLKPNLSELSRVARKGIVISVPNAFPFYRIDYALPLIGKKSLSRSRHFGPGPKLHRLNPSHKWEIGRFGIKPSDVVQRLEEVGLQVIRQYRVNSNPYHHFFIASK